MFLIFNFIPYDIKFLPHNQNLMLMSLLRCPADCCSITDGNPDIVINPVEQCIDSQVHTIQFAMCRNNGK